MDLLDVGDLVYLSTENDQVKLDQIPQAQSSLISFNPKTGEVLSYVGGSVFNAVSYTHLTLPTKSTV